MMKSIFVSYNWTQKEYADKLEKEISQCVQVIRDKNYLESWDSLTEFMKYIRKADIAVLLISDEYLKSINCMYEVSQLMKDDNWVSKGFFVVFDNATKIYDVASQDEYLTHWNEKRKKIEAKIVPPLQSRIREIRELQKINDILIQIGDFLKKVSDSKNPKPDEAINELWGRINDNSSITNGADSIKLPVFHLPEFYRDHFSGRKNELKKIHRYFKKSRTVCVKQAITGQGGIGKTQLALKYADTFKAEYSHGICWVNAEKTPKIDLLAYAEKLGLIPKSINTEVPLNDEDILKKLNNWLDIHTSFLLIFDNVDLDNVKSTKIIKSFISRVSPIHVLITTRDTKLNLLNTKRVVLDLFTDIEAKIFVRKQLSNEVIGEEQTLNKLITSLGRLPLALEQATAYIADKDNNCDCKRYLTYLSEYGLQVFEDKNVIPKDYDKCVTTTWEISFKKLDEAAQQLLYLCAYMAPENISLDLFRQQRKMLPAPVCDALCDEVAVNSVVTSLTRYALVKRETEFLSIHRLVQMVVRQKLKGNIQWVSYCFNMVCDVFKYKYGDKPSMDAFAQNAPHALEIVRHAEELLDKTEAVQAKIAQVYNEAGRGIDYGGQYDEALMWFEKALAIREKIRSENNSDTADTYNNIANVYRRQALYDEALTLLRKALDICERTFGKDHPETAATYYDIGHVYYYQGEYVKALAEYKKALNIHEVAGKKPEYTAATHNSIGCVYYRQRKYKRALTSHRQALNIYKTVLGEEHPYTASTYCNVARVYCHTTKSGEALKLCETARIIIERLFGNEHSHAAMTYSRTAEVYAIQREYKLALEWFEKALAIYERVLGKDHPETANIYRDIASVYEHQGQNIEALVWYRKTLHIFKLVFGEEHKFTKAVENSVNHLSKSNF